MRPYQLSVILMLATACIMLLGATRVNGQTYRLHGKVTNVKLEPLALVTVELRDLRTGVTTGNDGSYSFDLEQGTYELAISMMGYKSQLVKVIVLKQDNVQNVILEEGDVTSLSEVVVHGKTRDRSREIITQVIRHKDSLQALRGAYSVRVYIKAIQDDSSAIAGKKKKSGKKAPPADTTVNANAELQRMAMAEILLQYDYESVRRNKEERLAVKTRGPAVDLFYLSTTDGDFDFYQNLVNVPGLSTTPFLSPVSYSGLAAYRTRLVKTDVIKGRKRYTISIKPGKLSNATVEGEIVIEDGSWLILHTDLRLPVYHLPQYDYFQVQQDYSDSSFLMTRQAFTYFSKTNKGKKSGGTVVTYTDYELQKKFPPKYFGSEVSSASAEAYERDSSFWQQARTEPLTEKEVRFVRYKDSVYTATHTKTYLDSVDAVINRVTWKKILFNGQPMYNREKERLISLPSLFSFFQPFAFGGVRLVPTVWLAKTYKDRKAITLFANVSYGFRNHDVNGSVQFYKLYNPFTRAWYRASAGREFAAIFSGDAWINQIKRSNFYLNNAVSAGWGRELVNGLYVSLDYDIAFRRSLSNYKVGRELDSLLNLRDNDAPPFESYNASYGKMELRYTFRQRYIREPREKIILGSYWPTLYTQYRKGIPGLFKSDVDFDYLEFGLQQTIRLGLVGASSYTFKTGSFLNTKDLRLVDYKFQRRGDPFLFMNPNEAFQMLDSTFPLFKRFYEFHYVHEFNGAILNKIPFLKKLELREIAGAGLLSAPERHLRYGEIFTGIERVFKAPFNIPDKFKLGFYIIGSAANQFRNPVQFKVGITSWDKRLNKWR